MIELPMLYGADGSLLAQETDLDVAAARWILLRSGTRMRPAGFVAGDVLREKHLMVAEVMPDWYRLSTRDLVRWAP